MLKITKVVSASQEVTLQLDGRVTGPWVELLRESAESNMKLGLRLTLDLENLWFVDCEGLALMKSLIQLGVQPINVPLFIVEQLRKCESEQGERTRNEF